MCFRQKYQESLKITEYPIHQLRRLGRLEVHIALSNRNIDVQILAQGYCFATVSLSLYFKLADDIRKALLINQGTERIEWFY